MGLKRQVVWFVLCSVLCRNWRSGCFGVFFGKGQNFKMVDVKGDTSKGIAFMAEVNAQTNSPEERNQTSFLR